IARGGDVVPPLPYVVACATGAAAMPVAEAVRRHFLELPDHGLPTIVHTLATQLRADAPPDAGALAIARASSDWLERHRRYALPGEQPSALGATLAIVAAAVCLRRRRRQDEPTIRALERAIRAASLSLRPGETPRELLLRATAADLAPRLLARLVAATARHED